MVFLKNIDMLVVATSDSKLQNFGNFEYKYLLKSLTYIMILHTRKAYN